MKVLFTASGTGGHLVPAIRLARGVMKKDGNCQILFIGGERGLERQMIAAAGFALELIPARGFVRSRPWRNVPVLWALAKSLAAARRIVRAFGPDVAVGTGGYVTGPVMLAAHRAGVPTLIHEQNRKPGLTTRWLSRIADCACVAFPETVSLLAQPARTVVTGNPIDVEAISTDRKTAAASLGLAADRPTILVTGGSQGAHSINENIARGLRGGKLSAGWQVIWQTGARDFDRYRDLGAGREGIVVQPFIAELARVMAAADVIVARAGALTIAEITARGLPAVLVPFPFAAADHQTENAQALADAGAAVTVADAELATVSLLEHCVELLSHKGEIDRMRENSRKLGQPQATEKIAEEILRLGRRGKRG